MKKINDQSKALIVIGILFFVFGFVTWLNGILIPFLKIVCELKTDLQAFLVTFAFYMAFFFLALPSSLLLRKTGYKYGMAWGLVIMATGSLLFIPAAMNRSFALFLTGLFVQGTGLALLQTASNPYISIIGPIKTAARRMSIMGVCNKIAGVLSPILFSAIMLKDAGSLESAITNSSDAVTKVEILNKLSVRVIQPYLVMTLVLLLLAYLISKSRLPEIDMIGTNEQGPDHPPSKIGVLKFPHLLLGVLCLFLYVGVEVLAGDAIGIYGQSMGMSIDETKYFTSFTLVAMLVGYIIGIVCIPKVFSQQKGLQLSAILGIVFATGAYLTTGYTSIIFIALLGLANALMWPAIFPLAINGLGKYTKTGSALLVMGISGGAVIPLLYGYLKVNPFVGNNLAFYICMIPAYGYILFYAVAGHEITRVNYIPVPLRHEAAETI